MLTAFAVAIITFSVLFVIVMWFMVATAGQHDRLFGEGK